MSQLIPVDESRNDLILGDLDELIEAWLNDPNKQRASDTIRTYETNIRHVREWLWQRGLTLRNVVPPDLVEMREEWRKQYAAKTVNLRLTALRSFYEWCIEKRVAVLNPASVVKGIRQSHTRHLKRDELSGSEINALIEACNDGTKDGIRDRAIFGLMSKTAIRAVAIRRANVEDIKTKDGRTVLWYQGKGHVEKDDYKTLPPDAEGWLREWLKVYKGKSKDPLFPSLSNQNKGDRLSDRGLREIWYRRKDQAGIVGEYKTIHSLRHSALSNAARRGADEFQLQVLGGWKGLGMARHYIHDVRRTREAPEDLIDYSNGI